MTYANEEETYTDSNSLYEAEQVLLEWKARYGYVYMVEIEGIQFVYRTLSTDEYRQLEKAANDRFDLEELVCHTCVLEPIMADWGEQIYAGYVDTLAQAILEQSLILIREGGETQDVKTIVQTMRNQLDNSFVDQLPLIIKHCFPEYSLKELTDMPLPLQLELYAKASWMLSTFEGTDISIE